MGTKEPKPGDLFLIPDDDGYWAASLRFVRMMRGRPGVAVLEDDNGVTYECSLSLLQPARVAIPSESLGTPEPEDPVEAAELRRYRRRSRRTAQQRANGRLTNKQRTMIFGIGKRIGFGIDDLRAMTPQGSISKLTVREAGELIDRLLGKEARTGT
jgi:hypothetical protein